MPRIKLAMAALAAFTLTLSACSTATASSDNPPGYIATDLSNLKEVPEIAAMVPEKVSKDGVLTVGSNVFYAPAESYALDGATPMGYDIDMANALGAVMGLKVNVVNAEFAQIIPGIGAKYEVGIAAFSTTPERLKAVDMIPYLSSGSAWSTQTGNPTHFDFNNLCGERLGVLSGTIQADAMDEAAAKCGDNPPQIQKFSSQNQAAIAVASGQLTAMYTDSVVGDYAVKQSDGKLERMGEITQSGTAGIAVAKKDRATAEAVRAALQYLIDTGELKKIFATWGITDGVPTSTTILPEK